MRSKKEVTKIVEMTIGETILKLPQTKLKYQLPRPKAETQWKTWQYAQKRMGRTPSVATMKLGMSGPNVVGLTRVMGLLCMEAIFRVKDVKTLFDERSKKAGPNLLRKAEAIWASAAKDPLMEDSRFESLEIDKLPGKEPDAVEPVFVMLHARDVIRGEDHIMSVVESQRKRPTDEAAQRGDEEDSTLEWPGAHDLFGDEQPW
jgi:hypothetical protein